MQTLCLSPNGGATLAAGVLLMLAAVVLPAVVKYLAEREDPHRVIKLEGSDLISGGPLESGPPEVTLNSSATPPLYSGGENENENEILHSHWRPYFLRDFLMRILKETVRKGREQDRSKVNIFPDGRWKCPILPGGDPAFSFSFSRESAGREKTVRKAAGSASMNRIQSPAHGTGSSSKIF